jgi:hypothetical protein
MAAHRASESRRKQAAQGFNSKERVFQLSAISYQPSAISYQLLARSRLGANLLDRARRHERAVRFDNSKELPLGRPPDQGPVCS